MQQLSTRWKATTDQDAAYGARKKKTNASQFLPNTSPQIHNNPVAFLQTILSFHSIQGKSEDFLCIGLECLIPTLHVQHAYQVALVVIMVDLLGGMGVGFLQGA